MLSKHCKFVPIWNWKLLCTMAIFGDFIAIFDYRFSWNQQLYVPRSEDVTVPKSLVNLYVYFGWWIFWWNNDIITILVVRQQNCMSIDNKSNHVINICPKPSISHRRITFHNLSPDTLYAYFIIFLVGAERSLIRLQEW